MDPRFKLHKFWCSVEHEHGSYLFNGSFDLEADARIYCKVLFNAKPSEGTIVKTVALMKYGRVIDVWDGNDWHNESVERMYAKPINIEAWRDALANRLEDAAAAKGPWLLPRVWVNRYNSDDERDY